MKPRMVSLFERICRMVEGEILHPEQKLAGCWGRDRGLFEAEVGELRLPLWSSRENDLSPTRCHDAHLSLSETHSSLHLCDPAIHEQLDSRDVATVVGREEHHGLGNLAGSTEAAEG